MHDYMTTFTPFHSKLNISEKPQLYTIANPNVLSQTYLHIVIGWPLYVKLDYKLPRDLFEKLLKGNLSNASRNGFKHIKTILMIRRH